MARFTEEIVDRYFLSGRLTAKTHPKKRKPSSPRRTARFTPVQNGYEQDAVEAFHNWCASDAQIDYLKRKSAQRKNHENLETCKINQSTAIGVVRPSAPRQPRAKCTICKRSSAASGDSNGDGNDPDPEPELRSQQQLLQLFDQAALADLLCISKKSLQNTYSKAPHTLPSAISIPGARGPRWTTQSVQSWLNRRPAHANTEHAPAPTTKRKVGRPRIALAGKGGGA